MAVRNWVLVCSKAKVLSLVCLLGLVINFLIFYLHGSSWGIYELSESDEQFSQLGNLDVVSYIRKHKSNADYNEREIWSNILNLLDTLSTSNQASLPVLREIILSLRNRQDVSRLLVKLEQTDLTLLNFGAGNWTKELTRTDKPRCPDYPPDLLGHISSNLASVWPVWLEKNFANIQGGHYAPEDCVPKEKTAIIIPYRSRYSHLHILLNNLLPFLIRQQLDFRIFVVEQAPNTTFNRGMLFNVGYLEALKIDNYNCFIFHDVDMIPLNDNCLYKCAGQPRHLTAAISKWKYGHLCLRCFPWRVPRLPYKSYFGGAVAFTREQFKNINGCSNLYFGWGGEDDDLRARILKFGYKMLRYSKEIGRYDTIIHMPDSGNSPNPDRLKIVESSRGKQTLEGLNTTRCNVTRVEFKPLYTWIRVFINMTEVLQGWIFKRKDHIRKHPQL